MGKKPYVIKISNIFVQSFSIWYSMEILFNTTLMNNDSLPMDKINSIVGYVVLGLMLFQIVFLQKYAIREIVFIIAISILVIISVIRANNNAILSTWIFIISSKNVSLDDIVKVSYKILLIMIGVVFFLYFMEIIPEVILYREGKIRHSLGFIHPNQLGLRIFQLIICRLFIRREGFKTIDFIFQIGCIVFVYFVPNSQTSFIALILLFVFSLINEMMRSVEIKTRAHFCNILVCISALLNAISIFLSTHHFENRLYDFVNNMLSDRFYWGYKVYSIYGVTFFGKDIAVTLSERTLKGLLSLGQMYLDNAYLSLLLRYGVFVYFAFSILYYSTMIYLIKRDQMFLVMIMFTYSIYGLMETGLYHMSHNVILLAMAYLVFDKIPVEKNRKITEKTN